MTDNWVYRGMGAVAARVIHVGVDTCHRLPVLENAGYRIRACASISQLRAALESEVPLDAVLISEGDGAAHQDAVALARSCTAAPIVLFRETQRNYSESAFDLVIPLLDPPRAWLPEIAALIAGRQALCADARALQQESASLRRESAADRAGASGEWQSARQEYGEEIAPPSELAHNPQSEREPDEGH